MIKKSHFILLFYFSICLVFLTGCGGYVPYYERIDTVVTISNHIAELYSEEKITIGEIINNDNVSEYCEKDSELYKILNTDNEYQDYYATMINDNIVLVKTNISFNTVEGFLVTLSSEKVKETYKVSKKLGYDGNKITNVEKVDKYTNVYTYRAGT